MRKYFFKVEIERERERKRDRKREEERRRDRERDTVSMKHRVFVQNNSSISKFAFLSR